MTGSLRQIVLDDKGFVLVLAFGLSGSSYNDDCCRAVDLGFLIKSAVGSLNFAGVDVKIGIASGTNVIKESKIDVSNALFV